MNVPPLHVRERVTGGEDGRLQRGTGGEVNAKFCNRCGFEVRPRAWGCKNPCPNCGTVYPPGDCSD